MYPVSLIPLRPGRAGKGPLACSQVLIGSLALGSACLCSQEDRDPWVLVGVACQAQPWCQGKTPAGCTSLACSSDPRPHNFHESQLTFLPYLAPSSIKKKKDFFLAFPRHMEFLGQESDPSPSCYLSCSYSNAGSLTHYAWAGD